MFQYFSPNSLSLSHEFLNMPCTPFCSGFMKNKRMETTSQTSVAFYIRVAPRHQYMLVSKNS
uniref:Uncharacterized protein n=1 Tax=Rhizophora mucronata TaxID=61149 RepID=A0A2P2NGB5_RHIMU